MTVELPPHRLPVRAAAQDLAACVDILLENVFAHTPDGTAFEVRLSQRAGGGAWLAVSDSGAGFSLPYPAERGHSSGGSTGLAGFCGWRGPDRGRKNSDRRGSGARRG